MYCTCVHYVKSAGHFPPNSLVHEFKTVLYLEIKNTLRFSVKKNSVPHVMYSLHVYTHIHVHDNMAFRYSTCTCTLDHSLSLSLNNSLFKNKCEHKQAVCASFYGEWTLTWYDTHKRGRFCFLITYRCSK